MSKDEYIKKAIDTLVDLYKSGSIDSYAKETVKEAIEPLIEALKEES